LYSSAAVAIKKKGCNEVNEVIVHEQETCMTAHSQIKLRLTEVQVFKVGQ